LRQRHINHRNGGKAIAVRMGAFVNLRAGVAGDMRGPRTDAPILGRDSRRERRAWPGRAIQQPEITRSSSDQ